MSFADNLEPGDLVIIQGRDPYSDSIGKVERLTRTQVVLTNGNKYRRKNGHLVGGSIWSISAISPYDEDRAKHIKCFRLAGDILLRINRTTLGKLSFEQLMSLNNILP